MKKLIPIAIVAFLLYYVFTQPEDAANNVDGAADTAQDGAGSLSTFIGALDGTTIGILVVLGIAAFLVLRK